MLVSGIGIALLQALGKTDTTVRSECVATKDGLSVRLREDYRLFGI